MSENSGPYAPILVDTDETTLSYPVSAGATYGFYVRARDNTGQLEDAPEEPDVFVLVGNDCNDNGVPDEIDVASGASADCNFNGVPDECEPDSNGDGVIDGCRPLSTNVGAVSVSHGGTQVLSLQAGAANAGRPLLVPRHHERDHARRAARGAAGPLNVDRYFELLANAPEAGPVSPNPGILDDQGRATAAFVLPAGLTPNLIGLRLHHAFVLVTPEVDFVSNPVPLALVP